ncbi:MAG: DUF2069 domain-containing protein [Gammaproteobacteria bacterium]|jgi:uncharacterized membrane protein
MSRRAGAICAAHLAGLAVLLACWYLLADPVTGSAQYTLLGIAVLPLLMLAGPAWRQRPTALALAGFASLGYFAHGVMELVAHPGVRLSAGLEGLLACGVFISSTVALRMAARQRSAARRH